jgi:phosphodiesterase/alkaline phosphatase D-like protein
MRENLNFRVRIESARNFDPISVEGVLNLKKLFTIIVLIAALAISATAAPKHGPKAQAVKITDGPRVEGTGPTWAVIAWTTNTGGSSVIHYGTDANNLTQTAKSAYADNDKTKAQNHRVHLKNLKPNTKYFFQVDSGQGEGTGTEAKSSVAEFTTKGHK